MHRQDLIWIVDAVASFTAIFFFLRWQALIFWTPQSLCLCRGPHSWWLRRILRPSSSFVPNIEMPPKADAVCAASGYYKSQPCPQWRSFIDWLLIIKSFRGWYDLWLAQPRSILILEPRKYSTPTQRASLQGTGFTTKPSTQPVKLWSLAQMKHNCKSEIL